MDQTAIDFAETAILGYLQHRPTSADTAEGVHHWWISWEGLPEHISVTECALARLRAAGRIECVRLGNREFWRLKIQPGLVG